jgi:hypothetical protein
MGSPDPAVLARLHDARRLLIVVREALAEEYSNVHDAHEATTAWVGDDRDRFRGDMEKIGNYVHIAYTYLANQVSAYNGLIWDYQHGQG